MDQGLVRSFSPADFVVSACLSAAHPGLLLSAMACVYGEQGGGVRAGLPAGALVEGLAGMGERAAAGATQGRHATGEAPHQPDHSTSDAWQSECVICLVSLWMWAPQVMAADGKFAQLLCRRVLRAMQRQHHRLAARQAAVTVRAGVVAIKR